MWREETLLIEERKMNLAVGPEHGPPLLLLHGVTRCWRDFLPLTPFISERWQLNLLDFRGHGASDPAASYKVDDYWRDIPSLLESRFQEPAVIYGHSLGAMAAMAVAAHHPEAVHALILEDPPFDTLGERIHGSLFQSQFLGIRQLLEGQWHSAGDLARALGELELETPGGSIRLGAIRDSISLRFSARALLDLDPLVLDPLLRGEWLRGFTWQEWLGNIACPVLLLQADPLKGGMLMDAEARRIQEIVPECHLIQFPGAGHLLHWTETKKVHQLLIGFLESLL